MKLHVVFELDGVSYAVPFDAVLQMDSFAGATRVPGAPPYVEGVVTVRWQVVPVIDLRVRFGLETAPLTHDTRIIVTVLGERVVALRVDSAREVVMLDVEKHQPVPALLAGGASGFVDAVHSLGSRLLLLIDLSRILGENSDAAPRPLPKLDAPREYAELPH